MESIPKQVKELLKKRAILRKAGRFAKADAIRKKIIQMGYRVADLKRGTQISKIKNAIYQKPKASFLVLFGSGETALSSVRVHAYVFQKMKKKEIRIAIITTPAGFQPNVKVVYQDIANFFAEHLQNFNLRISIIFANTKKDANNPSILEPLKTADYIFTGPGSPTYAVKNLENSLLLEKIKERIRKGASLSLSSAAVIAFSHFTLPVYEIYKVGTPLYWEKGLNIYASLFKQLTIIPHLNNKEGGIKTDTSYCFIGKERFFKLLRLLPQKETVWGIDEHTALIIDLKTKKLQVMGKGKLLKIKSRE